MVCMVGAIGKHWQDAQKGCPARPQRVKTGDVPSGAHGATNKEHHVCARRRVGEAAGSPLRILLTRERSGGPVSASCLAVIGELQINRKVLALEKRHSRLEIILALAQHADLLTLNLRLYF